jgi:hypothetical protein
MDYIKLKEKQDKEFNEFVEKNMFFAYNDEQLKEGLKKLNTTTKGIYSIGAGGFVLKEKSKKLHNLAYKNSKELGKYMKKDDDKLLNDNRILECTKNFTNALLITVIADTFFESELVGIVDSIKDNVKEFNEIKN